MRILIAHNRYRFAGGEDTVMRAEAAMLRAAGHSVELLGADNQTIDRTLTRIAAASSLFHSSMSNRRMTDRLQSFQPDVVHIHNWFPQLSPSIIAVANAAGVPVVQTLHNFRMACAQGMMYRDGHGCRECLGKALPLAATAHACYATSRIGSALVTAAFAYHRIAHTWDGIATFIALSEYQRELLIRSGVSPAQLVVKPNFVPDMGAPGSGIGGYALFAARLTPQKGIRTVLQTWAKHAMPMPLWIMGDGELAEEVRAVAAAVPGVVYLGQRSTGEVSAAMADARFLIYASECAEAFGLTVVEAFSRGTPVLAAHSESIANLVTEGETGLCFQPGNIAELASKASWLAADTQNYLSMRSECRRIYEERYTEAINYELLMDIYRRACVSGVTPTQ